MNKEISEKIHTVIQSEIDLNNTVGASVLITDDASDEIYISEGFADIDDNKRLGRDTIFRLYSLSKPVTAVAAMQLVERGMLDLNMPVSEVIESFGSTVAACGDRITALNRPVTVLHLLNMTSGLTYGDDVTLEGRRIKQLVSECEKRLGTPDEPGTLEFAEALAKIPLAFQPDESWAYGYSADVLGAVIEKVSGKSFSDFLSENIFVPLGMKDTAFYVPPEKISRLASVYKKSNGKLEKFTENALMVQNCPTIKPAFQSGGAGLLSSIDDYSRFARMLLNRGTLNGVRILYSRTFDYLTSGSLTAKQQEAFRRFGKHEGYTYSHLLRRMTDRGQACLISENGEFGWAGWLGCYMAVFPESRITVTLMQQTAGAGTSPLTRKIINILVPSL